MDNNSQGVDIYEVLGKKIEEGRKENEQISSYDIFKKKIYAWLKKRYPDIIVFIGYIFAIYRLLYMGARCFWGIYYLNDSILPNIVTSIIAGLIIPGAVWLYSTCYDYWNFRIQKIFGLTLVLLNAAMVLLTLIFRFAATLLLPWVFKMPVSADVTENMVLALGRGIICLILVLSLIAIYNTIIRNLYNDKNIKIIMKYKLNRNWDTRKNKMFCYDMNIVRCLSTGKMHRVYEDDRYLHSMSIGTTGTGKTSTCMTVSINNDFDQRIKNEDYQKKKLSKLLINGKVRMLRDFDDPDFSAAYFEATDKKYEKLLEKIQNEAMPAGITALAPNEKFADEIYALAKSKSIKVNRVDPNVDRSGHHKEGFIGFNPLYISPEIKGIDRKLEVFSKARVFADVNQAIFEKDEAGDPYFTGLNRNLTTSITIMTLLTYPSLNNGRQPLPDVVQGIINDFSKAKPYRDELVRIYSTKFNRDGKDPIMDPGKADVGEYQFILDVIDGYVLGDGAKKMQDQATGLRNIINETFSNPLIRDVLCSENTIDLDATLEKGEITLVNFAINLGSAGTAFGMFYLLSYINAVLRRPAGKKLLPHFCYIDELPKLLHPDLDQCFSLFRQYRVGMFVALQNIDQLEKTAKTKYLKNVVLGGCSHHIVFGRCSETEMKLYEVFGGTKDEVVEMDGTTETALSLETTQMSMTHRESVQKVSNVEGGEMRYLDFREVTMFTVTKGSPEIPFYGKTFFLEDIKKIEKKRFMFNWSKYFIPKENSNDFHEDTSPLKDNASIASSNNLTESEVIIGKEKSIETDKADVVMQSQTAVDMLQRELEITQDPDNEIYISSGKEEINNEKEKQEYTENENRIEDTAQEAEEDGFIIGEE